MLNPGVSYNGYVGGSYCINSTWRNDGVLCLAKVMFIAVFVARRMLQDNAKLILDLKGRTVELGAVSSLLSVCYDAVVASSAKVLTQHNLLNTRDQDHPRGEQ